MVGDPEASQHANDAESSHAWSVRVNASAHLPAHKQADDLLAEATRIKRLDYDRLKALAEEAYNLSCLPDAEGNQYRLGMASSLALLAHHCGVRGESDIALRQTSQALSLLDSHEPSPVLGDLYLTMGWVRYQTGDYVDALHALVTAQRIAERIDDQSLTAFVMDRMANVFRATESVPLALDLQQRALAIHRELGDATGEALVLNHMTYAYLDLGRHEDALGTAFGALHYAESTERLYLLTGVLNTVAEVYLAQGDLDNAVMYAAQGLELARLHDSEPDVGDALRTMATIALQNDRCDEALEAAQESLTIAERRGRSIEEFMCHELLSRIQEQRGEIADAFAHYRRYHELERIRVNEETASRLANLQVEHEVDAARKDAEIHRLRSLSLQQEVRKQRIAQTQLEAAASLDSLTGLFNRSHVAVLEEDLEHELEQGRKASVILLDIDRFKEINDTFGHFAGDRALVAIAHLLRDKARDVDTPVRYGGDEFLMLLGGTEAETAGVIAERLRLAIATKPFEYRGMAIPLTVSIGVASVSPNAPMELRFLIERADHALYTAKRAGRNCVVADPS